MMNTIFGSNVITAVVAGIMTYLATRKQSKLQYITAERKEWRREIRVIAQKVSAVEGINLIEVLTELKVRLNAYGNNSSSVAMQRDSHIWELIEEMEERCSSKKIMKLRKKLLIEYLTLLLKRDWENAKREVNGEWYSFAGTTLFVFSYALLLFGVGLCLKGNSTELMVNKILILIFVMLIYFILYRMLINPLKTMSDYMLSLFCEHWKVGKISEIVIAEILVIVAILGYLVAGAWLFEKVLDVLQISKNSSFNIDNCFVLFCLLIGSSMAFEQQSILGHIFDEHKYYDSILKSKNKILKQIETIEETIKSR